MDILGPLPKAPGAVKYLLVAIKLSNNFTSTIHSKQYVIRGRYRRWLSRWTAAEGSLGYLGGEGSHGARAGLAIEAADEIGLVLDADIASYAGTGTSAQLTIGVRFGGFAGIAATLIAGVFAAGSAN